MLPESILRVHQHGSALLWETTRRFEAVSDNRLDPPHLPSPGFRVNSPHLIGYVAEEVEKVRNQSMEEILEITVQNGLELYYGAEPRGAIL